MNKKNVDLQFCGNARKIEGANGIFWSMELSKEPLANIISKFQNENDYVDLSIAEKKNHKPDEKNSHYVFSNVRYQDGHDTTSVVNLRIYKDRLAEVPAKEEHKSYFVTISPVDKEKRLNEGKSAKTDFTVYVRDKDTEQNFYIGAGWDIQSQREASGEQNSSIEICGYANQKEKEGVNFYSVALNKEKITNFFDVFPKEEFVDLTLAEKRERTDDEKTGYYIYPSLKYQSEKDNNPKAVMTLRIFKEEYLKAKAFNEDHSIFAGVFARDKEKDIAEGKETKSDQVVYAVNANNPEERVYLGVGFNKEEKASQIDLKAGDPVHIKVNDPVLKEFIGNTEQAAFGYVIAQKADNFKVHCCCGTYWVNEGDIKKATKENVADFDQNYQDLRLRYDQDKSKKTAKGKSNKVGKAPEKEVKKVKNEISDDMPF